MAGSSGARGREGLERNWKSTVLERFAIEIFSRQKRLYMSRSDGLRFFIGRSDGYQAIDDVEGSFAKTATRFQFLKVRFFAYSFFKQTSVMYQQQIQLSRNHSKIHPSAVIITFPDIQIPIL